MQSSLLPDGRIFGQITQKRPPKIILGRKKNGGSKMADIDKKWQKRGWKIFLQLFR
jgi:hypothetical protein